MIKLETLEILTKSVCCPNCHRFALQVNLSCETPKSPCDFNVGCDYCQYKFFVSQDSSTMEPLWMELKKYLGHGQGGCPQCGDNNLHLEFLCDAHSENCFFMVRCENNEHYSRLDRNGLKVLC